MSKEDGLFRIHEVIEREDEHLKTRRKELFGASTAQELDINRFGLALSGGGIRSATINLGFLKTLNLFDLLRKADYLSTVSGGGYTGSYIQATLRNEGDFKKLFKEEHIQYMRSRGEYMVPGTGLWKIWNRLVLLISFLVSLFMSWISPAILLLFVYGLFLITGEAPFDGENYLENRDFVYEYGVPFIMALFTVHFFSNVFLNYDLNISSHFGRLESGVISLAIIVLLFVFLINVRIEFIKVDQILRYLLYALGLVLLGFFTNPNSTSFHRFYRKQLADAFLHFTGPYKNTLLKNLLEPNTENTADKDHLLAPYPLINTCLNLIATNDERFKGTKASDYFLLSPFFCGSKLTNYVSTKQTRDYDRMTLPAAVTISAAAVNPGMGMYSNRLLGLLTTLFNARLGFWTLNPLRKTSSRLVWWPIYFLRELSLNFGTSNKMLNISDGGHIENLGVYELLRRKCRLIIAIDAGADPEFQFMDLENLTIRARNELGLDLHFREGQIPEETMRPKPSHGYSERRFSVADIRQTWEEQMISYGSNKQVEVLINYGANPKVNKPRIKIKETGQVSLLPEEKKEVLRKVNRIIQQKIAIDCKVGTFVYVKSSVTAPAGKPAIADKGSLEYGTYKYKIYHPAFPHEPTSDQFFDPTQWESYYQLGQFIAADVLGLLNLQAYRKGEKEAFPIQLNDLMRHFDEGYDLFQPLETIEEPFILERGIPEEQLVEREEDLPMEEEKKEVAIPPAPEFQAIDEELEFIETEIIEGDVNYEI